MKGCDLIYIHTYIYILSHTCLGLCNKRKPIYIYIYKGNLHAPTRHTCTKYILRSEARTHKTCLPGLTIPVPRLNHESRVLGHHPHPCCTGVHTDDDLTQPSSHEHEPLAARCAHSLMCTGQPWPAGTAADGRMKR